MNHFRVHFQSSKSATLTEPNQYFDILEHPEINTFKQLNRAHHQSLFIDAFYLFLRSDQIVISNSTGNLRPNTNLTNNQLQCKNDQGSHHTK